MLKSLKYKLIHYLAEKLMPIVTEDGLVSFSKQGKVFIDGKQIDSQHLHNLKEEARMLEAMELWKIINNNLNETARKTIFDKSKDFNDLIVGKVILYTVNVQNKIINKLKNTN